MTNIPDAPEIRRALLTGYGTTGSPCYQTEKKIYSTVVGDMDEAEFIEYLSEYIKSNPADAAEIFGVPVHTKMVKCDAYGEPI